MKKNFLFAAIALAAMSSCSKDEVVDVNNGNAIAFRASLDKATSRSNVTLLSNLNTFKVTAIGNDKNYFTDLAVTSKDNGTSWQTASTYYWPSFNLSFFAYAPQDAAGGIVSITKEGKQITNFSPKQAVAEQKDLVVAYNTGNRASNENSGVALNFKHALSQIEVKAKCLNSNIKIEVLGVRVVNAATTADFIFPENVTNTEYVLPQTQWGNWTGSNEPAKAYTVKGEQPVVLTDQPQSIMFGGNNFILIPQTLNAWKNNEEKTGAYLSVLCRIYSKDGNNEVLLYPLATTSDTKTDKYGLSAVALDFNWLPGKKYTYTLTFCGEGSGAGRIDPNPDTTDSTIDANPIPDGKGGDLILGAPIKFTVSVEDWEPVTVDVNMN